MIRQLITVGLGGFIGAIARYSISGFVHRYYKGDFPAGTLVVNILGCFIIGILMYLMEYRQFFSPNVRLFCTIGILGALTTFSTFGYETFELIKESSIYFALLNVAMNVLLGLMAVIIGWTLARLTGI